MRKVGLFGFLLTFLGAAFAVSAAGETLERDVGTVIDGVLNGWNHADAFAIAAQYEPAGDFISPDGQHAVGRHAIEAFYKAAFDAGYAGSHATVRVLHARNLSGTLALVDGSWAIHPMPASRINKPETGLFVAVLHHHDGRWWIVALREQAGTRTLHEL